MFNEQWTSDYCFILQGDKPLCLICKDTVGSVKKNNIKRHFDAKHAERFNRDYPVGSATRKTKLETLRVDFNQQRQVIHRFTSAQKKATETSLQKGHLNCNFLENFSFYLNQCHSNADTRCRQVEDQDFKRA